MGRHSRRDDSRSFERDTDQQHTDTDMTHQMHDQRGNETDSDLGSPQFQAHGSTPSSKGEAAHGGSRKEDLNPDDFE